MKDTAIYRKTAEGTGQKTCVSLIGTGQYAIMQTDITNSEITHIVYLTRQDLTAILAKDS